MLEHSRRVVQSCVIVRTALLRTFDPGNRGLSQRHVPPLRCFISAAKEFTPFHSRACVLKTCHDQTNVTNFSYRDQTNSA